MDIFQKVDMLKELIKKNVRKIEPDTFYRNKKNISYSR
jgi:hypothetical protein